MRIFYAGYWSHLTGFGRACRDYVACLHRAGHEVTVFDWAALAGAATAAPATRHVSPEHRYADLDGLVAPEWPAIATGFDVAIVHGQPALLAKAATDGWLTGLGSLPRVAMTTWESSWMPKELAYPLAEHFHGIIVPSLWCKHVLQASVRETDAEHVYAVPHTADPAFWTPMHTMAKDYSRLTFYAMGAWSERKNHLATVRAFLHAFGGRDKDVQLILYSHDIDPHAVRSQIARSGLAPNQIPRVDMQPMVLGEEDLRGAHQLGDVFVSSSRGEGWGLPCFEAALLGKEIISPTGTGEDDFLFPRCNDSAYDGTHRYAGLRDVRSWQTPCFAGPGQLIIRDNQIVGEKASGLRGVDCRQTWREVDVGEMAVRMHGVYSQWRHHNTFAVPSDRTRLAELFGYDVVARRLVDTLRQIVEDPCS